MLNFPGWAWVQDLPTSLSSEEGRNTSKTRKTATLFPQMEVEKSWEAGYKTVFLLGKQAHWVPLAGSCWVGHVVASDTGGKGRVSYTLRTFHGLALFPALPQLRWKCNCKRWKKAETCCADSAFHCHCGTGDSSHLHGFTNKEARTNPSQPSWRKRSSLASSEFLQVYMQDVIRQSQILLTG